VKCWCEEVRDRESNAMKINGLEQVSEYECWECRDLRLRDELVSSGNFVKLAIFDGVSDFGDFKRLMNRA